MESKEITSVDRQGFSPVHMVLICFRFYPFMSFREGIPGPFIRLYPPVNTHFELESVKCREPVGLLRVVETPV